MSLDKTINIVGEMKQSYLDYSMSVIVGRALPDVRDGFKPVHRRILYAMFDEGLLSGRKYSKCAGVVGEVLKKYHPHGDSAVYDALVRLAQPWAMRYPLVDGQGNFGSIDGDRAAAYRYTEARMQSVAEEMLTDIDKDTVDWIPNFDEQVDEPVVLPARFPNLLVNGSSGIAVGMATNIPPHNLMEVTDGLLALIRDPDISLERLMTLVKGPDFPTGGAICGYEGIGDAYRTGKGRLVLRAKTHFESFHEETRQRIVVDEIPYMVNKAKILEKIEELVKEGRLEGISEIRDESDRHGMRMVVEIKRGEMPEVILNKLFQMTNLQTTFGVIMLALVDQQPRILNLKEMLYQFKIFREGVVLRRTRFLLDKAERRAHILEGFVKALDVLDALIQLIRQSSTPAEARSGLMTTWDFTEVQAQAILEMRLQKLTGMEREGIIREFEEIKREIAALRSILEDPEVLKQVLISETEEIRGKYGDERRTEIRDVSGELRIEDLIADEQMVITCSVKGYIKRTALDTYRAQRRGGKGRLGMRTRDEDLVEYVFAASAHDVLMVFTSKGRVYWMKVHEIPPSDAASRGKAIVNLLSMDEDEKVVTFHAVRSFPEDRYLVFATRLGQVKKTPLSAYGNMRAVGIKAIQIVEGDELISVRQTDGEQELFLASRMGKAVRFSEERIRPMGRDARGVRGMRLLDGDELVEMSVVESSDGSILTVSEHGYGKRTPVEEYRLVNRGGQGVTNMRLTEKTGLIVRARFVNNEDSVLIITRSGKLIRLDMDLLRTIGRATQGVRLIHVEEEADAVVDLSVLPSNGEEEDEGPEVEER